MESWTQVLSTIGMLLLMVGIFVAAYYTSKALGKQYQRKGVGRGIEILESAPVGKGESLIVARVAKKVYFLGATAQSISLISELPSEEFPDTPQTDAKPTSFVDALKGAIEAKTQKKNGETQDD